MCPICLTTAAWTVAAGTSAAGGLTALLLGKRRREPAYEATAKATGIDGSPSPLVAETNQ